MKATELKKLISEGGLEKYSNLYADTKAQAKRFINAIDAFTSIYGDGEDLFIFSVPGRSEISGNHTDHNRGCVLAGAIDRDIIAVVSKTNADSIRFKSEGYAPTVIDLSKVDDTKNFPKSVDVNMRLYIRMAEQCFWFRSKYQLMTV